MDKNRILILITCVFVIILAILSPLGGQGTWGVILLLVAITYFYWNLRQKRTLMEKEYYTLEQIEDKFRYYRNLKHSVLTKKEYGIFVEKL